MTISNIPPIPSFREEASPQEPGEPPDSGPAEGPISSDPDMPLPTSRSLVVKFEHARKPGHYYLLLKDNDEVSPLYKSRIIKHFLSNSVGEFAKWERELGRNGQIMVGPYLHEIAESKAVQIAEEGRRWNYVFEMAFIRL